ncbi:hypothetical protein ACFWPQ_30635 [Streptomyces sp. NPDC058464]|uniref:hypothetical protein n=1 Tax=Streptomyces sp. NPDC058464 TaxID=3346511 RepID=UPI00364ADF15
MTEVAIEEHGLPGGWVRPGEDEGLDPRRLRHASGCFPSGVIAVCALADDGRPTGMAVTSTGSWG